MGRAFAAEGIPFVGLIDRGAGHYVTALVIAEQMRLIGERDAVRWCAGNAESFHADPQRLVVAGDSAGGGTLSAVVALQPRDAGGPQIALQVLIYPATDLTCESDSYVRNAQGYMLTANALRWFADRYVPIRARRADWRVSPLLHPSLRGVAPALVIAAEHDPLVDEDKAYADRLSGDGVAVEYVCYLGMLHPFFTLGGVIDEATRRGSDRGTNSQPGLACNAIRGTVQSALNTPPTESGIQSAGMPPAAAIHMTLPRSHDTSRIALAKLMARVPQE